MLSAVKSVATMASDIQRKPKTTIQNANNERIHLQLS